jgi:hypothetical protein
MQRLRPSALQQEGDQVAEAPAFEVGAMPEVLNQMDAELWEPQPWEPWRWAVVLVATECAVKGMCRSDQ